MIPSKKTFCVAPFQHSCITSEGKLRICCISNEEEKKHQYNKLENWYNSNTLKNLRNDLIKGEKNIICKNCWNDEETGKESQRQIYNKHIGKIDHKNWDKNFKKNLNLINLITNISHKNINSFDLKLGNLCNLKCIMCNADSSSQLLAEAKIHPELKELHGNKKVDNYQWPESKEFQEWCKSFLGSAIHIKFTGGEPFLNPYLLDTLNSIPAEQKSKCILHFTTNLTVINEKILDVLSSFKKIWLSVSIEGIGEVLEYARYGHQWKNLKNNLNFLIKKQTKNIVLSVNHVVQSPTFAGINNLVKYFDKLKIKLEPIFLNYPKCFQLLSIKKEVKKNFIKQFENYKDYNLPYITALRTFVHKNMDYDPLLAKQCVSRLKILDNVRKNNFEKIIPLDYFI